MRILITGSGGFVGKHLYRILQDRAEKDTRIFAGVLDEREAMAAAAAGIPEKRILRADVTHRDAVRQMVAQTAPDRVIHLAAQASVGLSFREPALTMDVNVKGTAHLLEAMRQVNPKARILIVGSIDQYGRVEPEKQPIPEIFPLTGCSPYGESKKQQEQLALRCVREYGQDIVLARSAPHIGRGQSRQFAVADWAAQIGEMKRGERDRVLTVGNLEAIRDIADVRDVAYAYLALLEKGEAGQIYNVGTGKGVRMAQIPPMLGKLAGLDGLQVRTDPARLRPVDIPMLVPDVRKLKEATGWQPAYRLEQTLAWMLGDVL